MSTHVVVMGVCGSGKSTVGMAFAEARGIRFLDGDDLHPPANVAKMSRGEPLTDEDRAPWLRRIGEMLAEKPAAVVACSALRRSYRDMIREACPGAVFVHLDGTPEVLRERMSSRDEHFMPASLLSSQLAILEPLAEGERGLTLSVLTAPEKLVVQIEAFLRRIA